MKKGSKKVYFDMIPLLAAFR